MSPQSRQQRVALILAFASCFLMSRTTRSLAESLPAAESGPCSLEDTVPATIAFIDVGFEFLLDDGRRVFLPGLEYPEDQPPRAAANKRFSSLVAGRDAFIQALATSPDRWGRIPALVFFAPEDGPLVSAGELLLSEGLARFRPDPYAEVCADRYRAAEEQGRAERKGVWTSADNEIIKLSKDLNRNSEALLNRKGMILVEGVVFSVGQARGATYLNFGPRRNQDLTLVISQRNLAMFERVGVVPKTLAGRRVRARGLIDTNFGPHMELVVPSQLEVLDSRSER
jgi:hypothetical protein